MSLTHCYIVRIYRRNEHDDRNVAGLVETVSAGHREQFSSPEELWQIIGRVRTKDRSKGEARGSTIGRKREEI